MNQKKEIFKEILLEKLPAEGIKTTEIKGLTIFRRESSYNKKPQLYKPQIIMLAQGKKRVFLGDKTFIYDPDHYFVQTLPMPVECEAIIEKGKPMLGMVITIDPQIIGEILFEMESSAPATSSKTYKSLYDAEISDDVLAPAIRLLKTLDNPGDRKVLGPIFMKEILYKILNGENGEILRELAILNRGFYHISRVINTIHANYASPFEVQELAREAGMSPTAFHSAFKSITSTSPLQYIKNVRLHKAKELIQLEGEKANTAALKVGYESSSQFSREYKRCFGTTPAKDRQIAS